MFICIYRLKFQGLIEKMSNNNNARRGQGLTLNNLETENNPLGFNEPDMMNMGENENPSQSGGYKRSHRKVQKKTHKKTKKTKKSKKTRVHRK